MFSNKTEMKDTLKNHEFFQLKQNIQKVKIKQINQISDEFIHSLHKKIWKFKTQQKMNDGKMIIQEMITAKCSSVAMCNHNFNVHPLIKSINIPKFVNLKEVAFENCKITSIQSLSFLDAPQIKVISLQFNKISNIKSISKWQFPDIQHILFKFKLIQQPTNISRLNLNLLSQSYFINANLKMKRSKSKFSQIKVDDEFANYYNFNTKCTLRNDEEEIYLKDKLQSLYIEDPSFYAKIELTSHHINHVLINHDQNTFKFVSKNRKQLPLFTFLPKFQQSQKQKLQKIKIYETQEQKNQQKKYSIKRQEQNVKRQQQTQTEQFRYLNTNEKKIIGYFLMKCNYKQLSPYLLHDYELGFDVESIEINKTKLNQQKIMLQRIQQINTVKAIRKDSHYQQIPKFDTLNYLLFCQNFWFSQNMFFTSQN